LTQSLSAGAKTYLLNSPSNPESLSFFTAGPNTLQFPAPSASATLFQFAVFERTFKKIALDLLNNFV
jgi:hypothetical protein